MITTEALYLILVILGFNSHWVDSQSCTQSLPLPSGADQNTDDSGVRPSKQPPIPVGGTLIYQCPGVKTVFGKTTWVVSCNELGEYVFPSDLQLWPICQCNEQIDTKCTGLTYKMSYIEQTGEVGKMTLLLPQPEHLSGWKMVIQSDMNMQKLAPWTADANLTIVEPSIFKLESNTNSDFKSPFASVSIVFNFTGTATQDIIPRWKYPCIANLECEYEFENKTMSLELWIIIAGAAAGFLLLVILCTLCVCCCCKGSSDNKRSVASATSQSSEWEHMEEMHFRQRMPRSAFD